jgi:small ligand-binding sensory domain FIST
MIFKAALSTSTDARAAMEETCGALAGGDYDLAFVFASLGYKVSFEKLLGDIWSRLNARNIIGCTAESIIGPDREVEGKPALAVWAASLPGVRVLPFVADQNDVTRHETPEAWHEHIGAAPGERPGFVVLPDPFSIDAHQLLEQMDEAYPGSRIVGGVVSGGREPGQNRLFLNDQVLRGGMVGVSLSGPIELHTVVSQGCRPVGEPFVVTRAHRNIIYELRGRPALEVLRGVFNDADQADQQLMQQGIHVGSVVDERRERFGPGDFLVRNLVGVDDDKGLAVAALIRPGQTIQFHVRDSGTADEEMRRLVAGEVAAMPSPPAGGLLFTCNGRGVRMFGRPNHDVGVVNQAARSCAVTGFFAAGEIGPVGNRTYIHGFTSSLVLFRRATPPG